VVSSIVNDRNACHAFNDDDAYNADRSRSEAFAPIAPTMLSMTANASPYYGDNDDPLSAMPGGLEPGIQS
jgi:hypothetical protein